MGVAATSEFVVLVIIVSQKLLAVTHISEGKAGGVQIKGRMLDDLKGLYAVRTFNEMYKEVISHIGPDKIDFDRQTKEFVVKNNK